MPPATSRHDIGIVDFLQGKNFLITGATGFVGKVLIEKMLRAVPGIGKIYLLIKGKDKDAVRDRIKNEIIEAELFKCLKQIHGKSYEAFMVSKLIPVVGNICELNLGMDPHTAADEIAEEVHVILNSAANTTFDERYDVSLKTNTIGPTRLLNFARKCKKLNLFLHISTVHVSGERPGVFFEKPFRMGQSIAEERTTSKAQVIHVVPALDVNAELKLAFDVMKSVQDDHRAQKMKDLGLERARMYGWRNTYQMTKAMGEMLINSIRGNIPAVIIRTSIIESSYQEPFPGWIEGYRMADPLILSYGKGHLPGFIGDPRTFVDVVPIDMVVNAIIVAMARHGIAAKPGLHVYHIASSAVNPLHLDEIFEFAGDHFTSSPLLDSQGKKVIVPPMKLFGSTDSFITYITKEIRRQIGLPDNISSIDPNLYLQLQAEFRKRLKRFIRMAKVYGPYVFHKGRYDNGNTEKLMEEMSAEESEKFGFDVRIVNWKHYFKNIHIPGLRRHIIKESVRPSISPTSRL